MPTDPVIQRRIKSLQSAIAKSQGDAVILHLPANTRYMTGMSSTYCLLLITAKAAHLMTDARYIETARATVGGYTIHLKKMGPPVDFYKLVAASGAKVVGFEPGLPYATYEALTRGVPGAVFVPATEIVGGLRRAKDAREVDTIARAQKIAEEVFDAAVGLLAEAGPGKITEAEFAGVLRVLMIERGVEPSFPPIVATGKNCAFPHYTPSASATIGAGMLLIDMGVVVDGYCSDMTRMVCLGKPDARLLAIHDAVDRARAAAARAIKAGAAATAAYTAAVASLKKEKLDDKFTHGLGHGVGLEIHEAPTLNGTSKEKLVAGDMVTIEPGVYIAGWGGVRIEDMGVVTKEGCRILTSAPTALRVI